MAQLDPKARLVFVLFNILYFIIGAGMFAVGIYNIISIQSYENFSRGVYILGGVLFVLIGFAKIVLSILGIIGWGTGLRILLSVYGVIALLVILPTLAAGIFGLQQWYYVFGDVGKEYETVFNSSALFESTEELRDRIRDDLDCCGIRAGASDFTDRNRPVQQEDCDRATALRSRDNTTLAPAVGCQYYVTDEIRHHLYYIGCIGLGFGFFELTSAIVAMQNLEGVL